MQQRLKKLLKILGEALIVVLVLIAIMLGIVRSLFPYIDRYRPYFETWASDTVGHPVVIEKVAASWKGLFPIFSFDNITIYDVNKTALLKAKQFQISINIFSSLITKKIIPAQLHLSGTHFTVHQLADGNLNINSIDARFPAKAESNTPVQQMLEGLLEQGQVILDNIDLDWYGNNGMLLPITNLKLQLKKSFFEHQVIGAAMLSQKKPTYLRFVVNLHGDILRKSHLSAEGYAYVENLDLAPWLKNHIQSGYALNEGNLHELQLWLSWNNQQLQQLQAVFKFNDGILQSQLNHNSLALNELAGNLAWQRNARGWDLALNHLRLQMNNNLWPLTQFSVQNQQLNGQTELQIYRANALALNPIRELLVNSAFIPDDLREMVAKIQPVGEIKNLIIRHESPLLKADGGTFSASADFNQLGFQSWQKLPGIKNLNGHVLLTPEAGEADLRGENLILDTGQMFRQPLIFTDYQGHMNWLQTADGIKLQAQDLAFNNSTISLRGNVGLYLPRAGTPLVQLLAGFAAQDVGQIHRYFPIGILSPKLLEWLDQAFVGGDSIAGSVLLQGPLSHFPFEDHTGHFEIAAHARNLEFSFHKSWPLSTDVNADVLLNGRHLQIEVSSAKILGIPLDPVQADIADLSSAPLELYTSVTTDAQDASRFIFASPLKIPLSGLQQLALKGPIKVDLSLEVPIHEPPNVHELPKVNGNVALLPGGEVALPAWGISMEQPLGSIYFTEHGAKSQGLQANWLGQAVNIDVQSAENASGNSFTNIQLTGTVAIDALINAYSLNSLTNIIKGMTSYTAQIEVSKVKGQGHTRLILDSDLRGVNVNLPDPVKKIASSKAPLHVQVDFAQQNKLNIFANYARRLNAALSLDTDKLGKYFLKGGNIRFGNNSAVLSNAPGFIIDGTLAQLNWSEVSDYLEPYLKPVNGVTKTPNPFTINHINLSINELQALGMLIQQANIQAQPTGNTWNLQIISPTVVGRVLIPKDFTQYPIRANFERFTLIPATSSSASGIDPGKVPPLNLIFQDFHYGQRPLGRITLLTFPQRDALVIEKLTLDTANLNLVARGRWQGSGTRQQTWINGTIKSTNIGAAMRSWEVTHSLENGKGTAVFALSWPAEAYKYDPGILNGKFSLDFTDGRIVNISQGTEAEMGIGRILNLLSLQSLPRRLTLDFSDLFSKGFTFDDMAGNFTIVRGNAMTTNSYLNGPIAKVEAQGRIGLGAKDYNLMMTITPYLTSSIPVVATIAGGPIVGAVAWVANKIFGSLVNHITSVAYRVRGGWANPVIDKVSSSERNKPMDFIAADLAEASNRTSH